MLRLHVRQDPDQFIKISSSISLGSNKTNDLVLNFPSVSDFHAEILVNGDQLAIVDLLSSGGTYLNSQPVAQKTSIKPWDIIQLGDVELELVDPNSCRPGDWGLRSKSNSLAAKVYPLENQVVVGRDATSDLRIESNLLSRQHARITVVNDRLQISDLNSTNGTYLNGKRIEQADAFPGDELRFDKLIFEVIGPVVAVNTTISDETLVRGNQHEHEHRDDDVTALADLAELEPLHTVLEQIDEDATQFFDAAMPVAFLNDQSGSMDPAQIQLIKTQYTIGRHPDCDISIDDSSLSKQHAKLEIHKDHWQLQDQNSSNGTWINSERVDNGALKDGDVIRLGRLQLIYSTNAISLDESTRVEQVKNNPANNIQADTIRPSSISVWKLASLSAGITLVLGIAAYWVYLKTL